MGEEGAPSAVERVSALPRSTAASKARFGRTKPEVPESTIDWSAPSAYASIAATSAGSTSYAPNLMDVARTAQ